MKKKTTLMIMILIVFILIFTGILIYKMNLSKTNGNHNMATVKKENNQSVKEKVDIIDMNSVTRPYAIVINNTPVAVKVQEGLNKAYLVYEIPTEGNTSRLLAFYKDIKEDLVIGTIRSARHNFIDFALESDAILCCFGWSIYAKNDLQAGSIDYFQGLSGRSIL